MFQHYMDHYVEGDALDLDNSFFCGDAAGRPNNWAPHISRGDHSDTDLKFALNLNVSFCTPEEYFQEQQVPPVLPLRTFDPRELPVLPLFTPSTSPLVPLNGETEVLIFVGYPASGKTSFFRKFFESDKYSHVNQDTLKSLKRCLEVCDQALKEGKSCVIDNTNPGSKTRAEYIKIARFHNVKVRCFVHSASYNQSLHQMWYRHFVFGAQVIPKTGFMMYERNYEEPKACEGFDEIKVVSLFIYSILPIDDQLCPKFW